MQCDKKNQILIEPQPQPKLCADVRQKFQTAMWELTNKYADAFAKLGKPLHISHNG